MFHYSKWTIYNWKGLFIPKTFVQEYSWIYAITEYRKIQCSRGMFRTLSIIYDGLFVKMVKKFGAYSISEINISIASEIWQYSKYTSTSLIQFFHSSFNIHKILVTVEIWFYQLVMWPMWGNITLKVGPFDMFSAN